MPLRTVVLAASCVLALAACTSDDGNEAAPRTTGDAAPATLRANAFVDRIVDGDTLDAVIDGAEDRVRLIGIDTPETKKPDAPIECWGPEATAYLEELLPVGTPIRIERDTVGRDDFGRLLGYVYRADDGVFVNYEIVRQGYATTLSIEPNTTHAELFRRAAAEAADDDLGLWGACGSR